MKGIFCTWLFFTLLFASVLRSGLTIDKIPGKIQYFVKFIPANTDLTNGKNWKFQHQRNPYLQANTRQHSTMVIVENGSVTVEESIKQILELALIAAVLYPVAWLIGVIKNGVVGAFDLLINGAKGVKNSVLSLVGLR